jgi:hypothetical protein
MLRLTTLAVVATLALGSFALVGCESENQTDLPRDKSGYTAGGNGAFGENPAQPGDYSYSNSSAGQSSSNNGNSR